MKLRLKWLLACSVLISSVLAQQFKPQDYKLVFVDDFNGTALDETVWNIEVNGDGGGNNELQYYRRENVSIGKEPETGVDCLILTAKKENYSGKTCTSGRVMTRNKMHYRYGMIEGRLKIPYTDIGLWPAFWMMGNTKGWPACGEIDIMEMGHATGIAQGNSARRVSGWYHWGTAWNMYGPGAYPNTGSVLVASYPVQGSFHTFRLYWSETRMEMYLDQDIYPNVAAYASLGIDGSGDASTGTYFRQSFFVLLNLAIGGNYPFINNNYPNNINSVTALNAGNDYEQKMYIDYIKVYQRGDTNEQFTGTKNGNGSAPGSDEPGVPVAVTGVSLKTATTIGVGATEQLTPTISPSNATNRAVTWKSSNETVATVSSSGLVTAKAIGNATITVTTTDGNKTATCAVTVTQAPPVKENLALKKPIESSDAANDLGAASLAVDGSKTSRWESKHGENNKTLTIDLQNVAKISEIVITWEGAYASAYNIEVSTNKTDWTQVHSTTSGATGEQKITLNNTPQGRYVRINCITRGTVYGFSIWEVEVYGSYISTGISNPEQAAVSLYINPGENILYIDSEKPISKVMLWDINGRKLLDAKVNTIDMSGYSPGVYLLTATFSDGTSVVKKIFKK